MATQPIMLLLSLYCSISSMMHEQTSGSEPDKPASTIIVVTVTYRRVLTSLVVHMRSTML